MAEILTTKFKTDATRLFYDDLTTSDMYVFVSGIELASISPKNALSAENNFLAKTLFGKKIRPEDTKFMIKYIPWNNGDSYVQYDDTVDLEDERFYAIVGPTNNDTGDYRVYKCLFNNYSGKVSSPPNFETTVEDQIYRTADGYVWKHLYAISLIEFEAYNALGYVPIAGVFDADPVANTSIQSTISDIFVTNKDINGGYDTVRGNVAGQPLNTGEIQVISSELAGNVNYHNAGYFVGQSLKARQAAQQQSTFVYKIVGYEWDPAFLRGIFVVDGDPSFSGDSIGPNAVVDILPRVEILGDGSGAVGIPLLVGDTIDSIQVLEQGSGYNNATARIVDPLFDFSPEDTSTTDVRAEIRPILSPNGDHGYNLLDELKCKHILLYGYITGDNNLEIGATNTYNGVGVVKSPQFTGASPIVFDNRIKVRTADYIYVSVGDILTQVNASNDTVFSGVVHEIDATLSDIYIAEYTGSYPNNQASGNGDTSLDLTLPFVNSGGTVITPNDPAVDFITFPEYIQRTGEVYFMEDFFPLDRNDLSREEFKIVLEF